MDQLPNLIIGGAQKCGTTSLHRLLASHDEAYFPPAPQEIHFFDVDKEYRKEKGLNTYANLFGDHNGEMVIGQTSPLYLYVPEVPARIHAVLPGVRLIFILRDPVDRAYSHYWHEVRYGWEPLPFETALKLEAERITKSFDARRHFSYQDRGRYAAQLARYAEYFSKSQILLVRMEDLKTDPERVRRQLAGFLGLDPNGFTAAAASASHHNAARLPRSRRLQSIVLPIRQAVPKLGRLVDRINLMTTTYPPMRPETRQRLQAEFSDDLRRLDQEWGLSFGDRMVA